ncbi:MAG: PIN domain-containing protein [Planctomycetes bacterium]|jgi:hypothetical protein|nr:PIN domain-containing protein [Planctomycetota bacterium]
MRAVDTQILVHAEISSSPLHGPARAVIVSLAEGVVPWAIPWPCVYEFMHVVTHPRVFHPPVPLAVARADLRAILGSPSVILLSETERHGEVLDALLSASGVTGNLVHDAHIAALCLEHGVTELLTADRDFARFPGLRTSDPLGG